MKITSRSFYRTCAAAADSLGLSEPALARLDAALAGPPEPALVWLRASGCSGCSVSVLQRIAANELKAVGDLLVDSIDLAGRPDLPVRAARQGRSILIVEGGVPSIHAGRRPRMDGAGLSFRSAVVDLAAGASAVVCIGTCSSLGGTPSASAGTAESIRDVIGRTTINLVGCPPHPEWILWTVSRLLIGDPIDLDLDGRPAALSGRPMSGRLTAWGARSGRPSQADPRAIRVLRGQFPARPGRREAL